MKGGGLFLHQQRLDTTTTAGKAMFQMLGVFAEFERGIIRERVNAGLARVRANCHPAWGPNADRYPKRLIDFASVGSMLGADSQSRGFAARCSKINGPRGAGESPGAVSAVNGCQP